MQAVISDIIMGVSWLNLYFSIIDGLLLLVLQWYLLTTYSYWWGMGNFLETEAFPPGGLRRLTRPRIRREEKVTAVEKQIPIEETRTRVWLVEHCLGPALTLHIPRTPVSTSHPLLSNVITLAVGVNYLDSFRTHLKSSNCWPTLTTHCRTADCYDLRTSALLLL